MKKTFIYVAAILGIISTGCSKSNDNSNNGTPPSVTTGTISSVTHNSATAAGTVTSEGTTPAARGICWSTTPDPNLNNNNMGATTIGVGTFSVPMTGLTPNTTYYARAYASNNSGTSYGSTVSFTTAAAPVISTTTAGAFDIISKSVTLKGTSVQPVGTNIWRQGFCYSTSPNPTVTSGTVLTAVWGPGNYSVTTTSSLQPNTTYYFKAFVESATNEVYYGAEMNFKTTGYFGASGGYVFYDKGETTNGWRYLEAGPVNLHYDIAFSTGAKFGCVGTNLTNTYPDLGKGLENTNQIINNCANANCAARLCAFYNVSGINGWFLPSKAETFLLVRSLYPMGVLPADSYWTSTELTQNNAVIVDWDLVTSAFVDYNQSKDWYAEVRPVRRY